MDKQTKKRNRFHNRMPKWWFSKKVPKSNKKTAFKNHKNLVQINPKRPLISPSIRASSNHPQRHQMWEYFHQHIKQRNQNRRFRTRIDVKNRLYKQHFRYSGIYGSWNIRREIWDSGRYLCIWNVLVGNGNCRSPL